MAGKKRGSNELTIACPFCKVRFEATFTFGPAGKGEPLARCPGCGESIDLQSIIEAAFEFFAPERGKKLGKIRTWGRKLDKSRKRQSLDENLDKIRTDLDSLARAVEEGPPLLPQEGAAKYLARLLDDPRHSTLLATAERLQLIIQTLQAKRAAPPASAMGTKDWLMAIIAAAALAVGAYSTLATADRGRAADRVVVDCRSLPDPGLHQGRKPPGPHLPDPHPDQGRKPPGPHLPGHSTGPSRKRPGAGQDFGLP